MAKNLSDNDNCILDKLISMEPFTNVDATRWPEIRDLFKKNFPNGVVGFCLFDMLVSFPGLSQVQVYCPFGDIHSGVICITDEFNDYKIHIEYLKDIQKMEEALSNTRLIDWNRNIMVPSARPDVVRCLEKMQTKLGVKVFYDRKCAAIKYYLKIKTNVLKELSPPPDTYVGPLKPEHITLVDTTWTYHGSNTYNFFESLMKHDLTWVLYSSKDHQPLAWITINHDGALTHLFCLEPHRRKGYAEYIAKVAISDWLSKGKFILAYTIENNVKAQKLFIKIGFEVIGTDHWLFVNKV